MVAREGHIGAQDESASPEENDGLTAEQRGLVDAKTKAISQGQSITEFVESLSQHQDDDVVVSRVRGKARQVHRHLRKAGEDVALTAILTRYESQSPVRTAEADYGMPWEGRTMQQVQHDQEEATEALRWVFHREQHED